MCECAHFHVTLPEYLATPLKASLSELCLQCHSDSRDSQEHRIAIIPLMKVLEQPMSKDGKITCATCHDPHEREDTHAARGIFIRTLQKMPSETAQYLLFFSTRRDI